MEEISAIHKYILEQVRDKKMDGEMAIRILKELTRKEEKQNKDIAIIGMDCRFSNSKNKHEYWSNLINGNCCIHELPKQRQLDLAPLMSKSTEDTYFKAGFLDDVDKFDTEFFRISPREAMLMDPKQRMFLETLYHAVEDAGYAGEKFYGSNTGIYVGNDHSGDLKISYAALRKDTDMLAMTGTHSGILASRASYIFNLKGPSMVIDTACSSGLVSVHLACEALKNQECTLAIAGGVNFFLLPHKTRMMNEVESDNGDISIFDKSARGTVWGEGVAAIVLKPLDQAVKDGDHIYAVIKGSAINNDGASNGITAPNTEAQEQLIIQCWKNAKIDPETISYIETHGTGTILGDPIEIKGIANAFKKYTNKKQFCSIGSVKPNIGHTVGASGMASLIKTVLAIQKGILPPTLNFYEPNPFINFINSPVYINDKLNKWIPPENTPRRAGVSSFGFSGTNSHVILEEPPKNAVRQEPKQTSEVVTISGKSRVVVQDLIAKYAAFIQEEDNFKLADFCYTLNTGRKHYEHRVSFVVESKEELKNKLEQLSQQSTQVGKTKKISYPKERELKKRAAEQLAAYIQGGKTEKSLLRELCKIYEEGVEIDWALLYQDEGRRIVSIPVYPFIRERHWVNIAPEKSVLMKFEEQSKESVWENQAAIQLKGRSNGQYTDIERLVGQLWGDYLGLKELDLTKDFYELGGDSIIASEIINSINKKLMISLQVADLFKNANVEMLSAFIQSQYRRAGKSDAGFSSLSKVPIADFYQVSSAQKRIFIINQLYSEDVSYNMPFFLMIDGKIDETRMEKAFQTLIERHESLRTSYDFIDSELMQFIGEAVDFRIERYHAKEEELDNIIRTFVRPFDLKKAPLIRVGLAKISDNKQLLMIDLHHIAGDGSSIPLIEKELVRLYEQQGLPALPYQYKDYAQWHNDFLKTEQLKSQENYWLNVFKGNIPVLELPLDYARHSEQTLQGDRFVFFAGKTLAAKLNQFNSKVKSTLFMTLIAAYKVLLHKYSGEEDIIVGSPISGRKLKELENMIGMFVNTLAFRSFPKADKSFAQYLSEVRETALQAYDNQDYPFEELVDKLKIDRNLSRNALFSVMFVLQLMNEPSINVNNVTYTPYPYANNTSKFDLILSAFPDEEDIKFEFTYGSALFKRSTIEHMAKHFIRILNTVLDQEQVLIQDIELLDEQEKQELIPNGPVFQTTSEVTIVEAFEKMASERSNALAVTGKDQSFTYRELNEKANRIARVLMKNQSGKGNIVAIAAERTADYIAGILGILKSGAAYLPIDSSCPQNRIQHMIEDSGASMMLVDAANHHRLSNLAIHVLSLHDEQIDCEESSNVVRSCTPEDLTYVIYTSGSTGEPKGVMIEHRNVINLVDALYEKIYKGYTASLNVALLAPFVFDASIKQIFCSLLLGHQLHVVPEEERMDMRKLLDYYENHGIHVSDGTPAYLRLLAEFSMSEAMPVEHFIIGGETLSRKDVERFYASFTHRNPPIITNVYGPTECCVDATAYMVNLEQLQDIEEIPIGKPIKNGVIYILDKQQNLLPKGIPGEIYIGGLGVGRGYLNKMDLTSRRFIQDPFHPELKMFRTDDIGKWTDNGELLFVGRMDDQVKVRGFRIELDEIKHRLLRFSNVKEAAVITRVNRSEKEICAYVVMERPFLLSELKSYLIEHLPDYMIPVDIIAMDRLPITHNGKVDFSKLPHPVKNKVVQNEDYVAPRNEVEEILGAVWSEVLGIPQIGINDNFFEIGGDSIKVIQAAARLEKYQLKIKVKDLFQYQTIASISSKVTDRSEAADNRIITGEAQLVPIQHWMVEHSEETLNHRNLSFLLYREEGFGEENVRKAFTKLVEHHDALRIIFSKRGGVTIQINRPFEPAMLDFQTFDLTGHPHEYEAAQILVNQIQSSMDVSEGPLMKVALIRVNDGEHLLIINHQLIIDHVSWRILLEDLNTAFTQLKNHEEIVLPGKTASFLQWSSYLQEYANSAELLKEKDYWRQVESAEIALIPTDFKSSVNRVKDNATINRTFDLDETAQILNAAYHQDSIKLESVFLTALGITMNDWKGLETIAVNLGNHGRDTNLQSLDIYRTIGRFSTIYPVVLQMFDDQTNQQLKQVNESLLNVPNKGIGYGILKYLTAAEHKSDIQFNLKPEISFNYMGEFDSDVNTEWFQLSSLSSGQEISPEEIWSYKFKFISMLRNNQLVIGLEYSMNQFAKETIETLLQNYLANLKKVAESMYVH